MDNRIELVFASRNPGKLTEFARICGPDWRFLPLPQDAPVPEEDGASYAENALAKALSAARHTGVAALSDDSGIEVDALDGYPGIFSARWTDGDHNAQLLARLCDIPRERRGARMRAAVAVALPDGRWAVAEGTVEGSIALSPRGDRGFGYDAIFLLPAGVTLAELEPVRKDELSHRGRAVASLRQDLAYLLGPLPCSTMRGDAR